MDNRFTIKDFFLFLFLAAIVVIVLLMMVQRDREWTQLQAIQERVKDQDGRLRQIQQSIARGVAFGPASRPAAMENDPFTGIEAAQKMPGYARGDWLVQSFPGQVAKLTPLLSGDAYADRVQGEVLESLATRDPRTLEWKGLLAQSWAIHDHTKERQTYIDAQKKLGKTDEQIAKDPKCPDAIDIEFTLREGLHFSDGVPLTPDDVVYTYNLIMNPAIAAPRYRAYLERIKAVKKTGPQTVQFIFAEPYFQAFEQAASLSVMPEHFYKQFTPQQFNQSVGLLLGSGPYRMSDPKSWKPGNLIQLVRNESYWGVAPAFNQLVYKEITGDKARLATFRNGDLDIFGASPEQYRQLIADKELMKRDQAFDFQNPIGGYGFIAWNEKDPLFADKHVRQALTMLLDRQRMIDQILLGYAVIATGPFNPQSQQYNPDVKPWPNDVEEAKKLLTAAGFHTGSDGVLVSPEGKAFKFRLTYPAGSAIYDKMVLFVKDAYAKAGIVVEADPLEWAIFTDRLNNKNFQAISLGWTSGIESDIYQMFHSSQMVPGGDDFISYQNPKLDATIDEARQMMDESKRMALWRKAHAILHEDQPYTFLWFGKTLQFVDRRIMNVQRVKLGLNPLEEWFVPTDLQKYTQ
jgi:peptide/nickel transport system substrate-binding protein